MNILVQYDLFWIPLYLYMQTQISEMLEPTDFATHPVSCLLFLCSARNVQQTEGAARIQKVSLSHTLQYSALFLHRFWKKYVVTTNWQEV